MKVKICGLVEPANIMQVLALKPDYIGFVFYERSPRYVGGGPLHASWVKQLHGPEKVGVFVNETTGKVLRIASSFGLDRVQLHGNEAPAECAVIQKHIPVIKAFAIGNEMPDGAQLSAYRDVCGMLLLDTACTGYGGSGHRFDWEILSGQNLPLPFLLSGGVGAGDAANIKQIHHPGCLGVDVNSRFEISPGIKNIALLQSFIHEIRH